MRPSKQWKKPFGMRRPRRRLRRVFRRRERRFLWTNWSRFFRSINNSVGKNRVTLQCHSIFLLLDVDVEIGVGGCLTAERTTCLDLPIVIFAVVEFVGLGRRNVGRVL